MKRLLTLAVALILFTSGSLAQSGETVEGKLAKRADEYLTRCAAFGFSGAVLVEKDGDVILDKAYGLADRSAAVANTTTTLFDIGSLTKQFTAAAVLCLEQDKKLRTTDPLSKFFEDVPKDKAKIQLHHLLNHTSGLPRGDSRIGSELHDRGEFLNTVFSCTLESKPGKAHAYSNIGYDLLAAVVELVSEQSFEEFCRERLFAPAEMIDTGFRGSATLNAERCASGHSVPSEISLPGSSIQGPTESQWEKRHALEGWYSWGLRGAGGVLSTTGDLRRWNHALFEAETILTAKSRKKLLKPGKGDYAYGWYVLETDRKTPWIEHGGSTGNGFQVKFGRFPEDGLLVVTLGNVTGVVPWVNINLVRLLVGEKAESPPAIENLGPEQLGKYAGVYEGKSGERFIARVNADSLLIEADNPDALQWLAPASTSWSKTAKKLVEMTEHIAAELAKNNFEPLHAIEGTKLFFFDGWWARLQNTHGTLVEHRVLGAVQDSKGGELTLLHLRYENGAEILKFGWQNEKIVSTIIGGPYPSIASLRPTSDSNFIAYDLRKSAVTMRAKFDDKKLVLEAAGQKLQLKKKVD